MNTNEDCRVNLVCKFCKKCGKEFYPVPDHVFKDRDGHYCSWTCFNHRHDGKVDNRWKRVVQLTPEGEPIRVFQSSNQAGEFVGVTAACIRKACKTKKKFKKYLWRYEE